MGLKTYTTIILLFALARAQFYDQNDHAVKRLHLLEQDSQIPYLIGSVQDLVNNNPYLMNPLASFLDSLGSEQIKTSGIHPADFVCDMFQRWTAPELNEQCAVGIKDYVCTVRDLIKAGMANATAEDLWVLQVIDAFGKVPSGIDEGDLLWLGDYKECKDIQVTIPTPWNDDVKKRHWHGQYCKASVGIPNSKQKIAAATCMGKKLERCNDPLTTQYIHVGLCVPRGCTGEDLDIVFDHILPLFNYTCNSYVECEEEAESTWFTWVILAFVVFIILLLLFGTLFDVFTYQPAVRDFAHARVYSGSPGPGFSSSSDSGIDGAASGGGRPHSASVISIDRQNYFEQLSWYWKTLLAFSVYSNGKKLLSTESREGTMACVHGIRFLSMAWVILGHTYYFSISYTSNIKLMVEIPKQFFFQMVNNATLSVDSFFVLSGFLLSYLFLKRLKSSKNSRKQLKSIRFWVMYYVHRYIRLTPTFAIVMAIGYAFWSHLGSGPMWRNVDKSEMFNKCPDTFWRNLLYINNMWEFGDQCIGWVWYLANDMQFYWISPPLLLLFYFQPVFGIVLSLILVAASDILRGWIVIRENYPPSVIATVNPAQWAALGQGFSSNVYQRPWMRIGPYLIGVILGYILLKTLGKLRMKKFIAFLIWVAIFAITFAVIFGLFDFARGHDMPDTWKGAYAALNRTAWAIAVSATIYLCLQGYGGFVNSVLSWKVWFPLSRLTYCAYLIHEMVIAYFYSTLERPFYATHYSMVYFFLANLALAYTIAAAFSLAFEAPVMQLEKLIFEPKKKTRLPEIQVSNEQNNVSDGTNKDRI